jgi:hypothetical protein
MEYQFRGPSSTESNNDSLALTTDFFRCSTYIEGGHWPIDVLIASVPLKFVRDDVVLPSLSSASSWYFGLWCYYLVQYLYFCQEVSIVQLPRVQGIGTR